MFGKHFASLYEGSMVGKGAMMFAVWGYVIAKQRPDRTVGSQVTLHPDVIAASLGEKSDDVAAAIEKLCSPDPASTSPEEEGRRLVKIGSFEYRVVNGAKYRAIRDEEKRREQTRLSQRKRRARIKGENLPANNECSAAMLTGASAEAWETALDVSVEEDSK